MTPAILVVTGASGSGKTAVVRALDARGLPGVRCYHFDAVGVPSLEEMDRDFGGGEQWQALTTQRWLDRFATDPDGAEVYVLDGQTRPSFVSKAAERAGIGMVSIVLLDCAPPVRHRRLTELRGQTELSNSRMDCWAAYLRGQADALDLPVIDTTSLGIDAVADALVVHIQKVRAEREAAAEQANPDPRCEPGKGNVRTNQTTPRVTSLAPQFLVDDIERSIAYYQRLGFSFGEPWGGFYAIGCLDGLELHLKEAPRNPAERQHRRENEHLDASAGVEGIETFYEQCVANGAKILKPLEVTPWGTKDFYIEDPDGYIVCFGGTAAG